MSSSYTSLLDELEKLSKNSPPEDGVERQKLADALRKASLSIETPLEFMRRVCFGPLQIIGVKLGMDLDIFSVLDQDESVSLYDLVQKTGAERELLSRLLRYLAASGIITQLTETTYGPNTITHSLVTKEFRAGINHHLDVQIPVWLALPSFLASISYTSPHSPTESAFQKAHWTSLPAFEWGAQTPHIMADFALWMTAQRAGHNSWLSVFTPEEIAQISNAWDTASPLFVDVGGGMGHQSYALRAWLPESVSTDAAIIFQDLPSVISLAKEGVEGVKGMVHDIFSSQPLKGASLYYLRNILHDHPDSSCINILENIKVAMGSNSTILIDDIVLPEKVGEGGSSEEFATILDIAIMATLAAKERTRKEWDTLFDAVGMYVQEVRKYDNVGNSILIVKKK